MIIYLRPMSDFPYDKSSLISDLFFGWLFPSIRLYYNTSPNKESMLIIPSNLSYESQLKSLKKIWRSQLASNKPNLLRAMLKVTYKEYAISTLLMLLSLSMNLVQAVIINYLVIYLSEPNQPAYEGALLTILFCVASFIALLAKMNSGLRLSFLSGKLKCIITKLVSDKAFRLNYPTISEESNRGKIINVVNSDIEALDMLYYTVFFWCAPFLVIFAVIIVVCLFGPIGLVGIAISVVHVPIVLLMGKWTMKYRVSSCKIGDSRIKMIENLIEGIKIMKLYAWEIPFLNKIFNQRMKQVKEQSKITNINGVTQVLGVTGTLIAIFATLALQVYLGNQLYPGSVFLLINIFNVIHLNIVYISGTGINTLYMLAAMVKRIEQVLLMKEHISEIKEPNSQYAICVENACISWHEEESVHEIKEHTGNNLETIEIQHVNHSSIVLNCLRNISFHVKQGQIVLIVGPVACGKSSLLISILGELKIVSGELAVQGKIAYASEEPWLIQGTIKENILMGNPFIQDLYTATLNSCALMQDLNLFANADETYVGDRGITLSGGQKARLGLARAVYSQSDIILLDDPLSAVDPEVANHIFQHCIHGQLKGKTVLLATHQIQFLSKADRIIVLNHGEIVFCGNYRHFQDNEYASSLLGDTAFKNALSRKMKTKINETKIEVINEKLAIEDEKILNRSIPIKTYWRYLKYGFKSLWLFIIFFIFLCFSQICLLSVLYWAAIWSKRPTYALQNTSYYYIGYGILLIIAYIVVLFRVYIPINLYLRSNVHLHNDALECIALTPSTYFDKNSTGTIISRFSKDVAIVDGPLQFYLYELMSSTMLLSGTMAVVFIVNPYSSIVFPFWILSLYLLMKYVSPTIFVLRKLELISRGPLISVLTAILNGLPTIRCLHLHKKFIQEQKIHLENYYRTYITFNIFIRFSQLYSDLSSSVIILINVTVMIATKGYIPVDLAAFSLSLSASWLGLTAIWTRYLLELPSNMSAVQRLFEFTELPSEGIYTTEKSHKIEKGHIWFDNVHMRYQNEFPLVLSGLSFEIQAGEKVGIVGRTGAGKSSVLQVLFRLVNPESGRIFLDGVDYMKMGIHEIREQMSVIPQSAVLFSGSIRENLDPFNLHTDRKIFRALRNVKLKNKVVECGEGLDIGVGGERMSLSAGEKQLLCLARAILRGNRVVMMDEATANLDNQTDQIIQKVMRKRFRGSTVLVIAHRVRTIISSDTIIVMEKGICKEVGTPAELFNDHDSLFRNMIYSTGPEETAFLISQLS